MRIALIVLALLSPALAAAQGMINPSGGNAWDLYIFGNSRVVADVLESIKLLVAPDSGSTGFRTLMLFMAMLGFLVMAVRAGFNPSQNFIPMVAYILIAWAVSWGTTNIKMNVNIIDGTNAAEPVRTIQRVPAVVALPAVLVSNIGNYFTTAIERYFTGIPDELKISGEKVNGFNLFGRVLQETNQFKFTSQPLRDSVRAYMADCVVPAIASSTLSADIPAPGQGTTRVYGREALIKSSNLMETLATAKHNAIVTRYFGFDESRAQAAITLAGAGSYVDVKKAMASGVLLSCADAYDFMAEDMKNHANALFSAAATAWSTTGTLVPLETTFSVMLSQIGSVGGANRFAAFGSPQGYITQQAVIGETTGAFRQAAMMTGNNEMLQAASIAQAEQNQRSAWAAGFAIFNNMMGYVYSVLQAFIFAIMPIIIIALFVPGLAKGIFVNYSQILLWLALWFPMLAVINYLVTLFGQEQIGGIMALSGGPTAQNSALVSEKTADLLLAANFLGVSVPMITWGLVKGAMAFTEFIGSGIGSSFATQAGASAASGNMSMGNLSMDQTSMNKFNTASQATVGFMQTQFTNGAGTLLSTAQAGGVSTEAHGAQATSTTQVSREMARQASMQQSISDTLSQAIDKGWTKQEMFEKARQSSDEQSYNKFVNFMKSQGISLDADKTASRDASYGKSSAANQSASTGAGYELRAGVGGSGSSGGPAPTGVAGKAAAVAGAIAKFVPTVGVNANHSRKEENGASTEQKAGEAVQAKESIGAKKTDLTSGADQKQGGRNQAASEQERTGDSESEAWKKQLQTALQASNQQAIAYSDAAKVSDTLSVHAGMDVRSVRDVAASADNLRGRVAEQVAPVERNIAATTQDLRQATKDAGVVGRVDPNALAKAFDEDKAATRARINAAKAGVVADTKGIEKVEGSGVTVKQVDARHDAVRNTSGANQEHINEVRRDIKPFTN